MATSAYNFERANDLYNAGVSSKYADAHLIENLELLRYNRTIAYVNLVFSIVDTFLAAKGFSKALQMRKAAKANISAAMKVKVVDEVVDVKPIIDWSHLTLSTRHFPNKVTIPKTKGNTMLIISEKEAIKDINEIRKIGHTIRRGEYFHTSSGRIYKIHNNTVHPVSGPGTINISSQEYKVLITAKKEGIEKALKHLDILFDKNIITRNQFENTKKLLEMIKKR